MGVNLSMVLGLVNALKGVQFTKSTKVGIIAGSVVTAIGTVLVAQNVMLPALGIPLTGAEVAGAAWLTNIVFTACTSDTTKDHIVGLALKLKDCLGQVPTATPDYPVGRNAQFAGQAQAAVAVINAHVDEVQNANQFPQDKNGV